MFSQKPPFLQNEGPGAGAGLGYDTGPGEGRQKREQRRGASGRLDLLSPRICGSEMESYEPSAAHGG